MVELDYITLLQAARKLTHNGEVEEHNVDPEYVRGIVELLATASELSDAYEIGVLYSEDRRTFTYLTLNIPPEWTMRNLF